MQLRDFVMQHPLYGSLPCQVPFSMYQVLSEAGKIKDPFDRDNELSLTALSEEDYSFETQFEADAARLALPYQVLRLEGVDTLATLSLNGIPIGKTYNMHRTWQFDIAGALRPGTNVLRITFHSPVQYMREQQNRHAVWGSPIPWKALPISARPATCLAGTGRLNFPTLAFSGRLPGSATRPTA